MSTATDFANNKLMMVPLTPAVDMSMSNVPQMSNQFGKAAIGIGMDPNAPQPVAPTANNNVNKIDSQKLLGDAGGVGQVLTDKEQKFKVKDPANSSGLGYASGQALQLGGELVGELFGRKNDDQAPKADNDDVAAPGPKFAQAPPQIKAAGPTPFGL